MSPPAPSSRSVGVVEVDLERVGLALDEAGRQPVPGDGVGRGREGEARQHDRAVGREGPERQHQPGGARRHRDDVAHAEACRPRSARARATSGPLVSSPLSYDGSRRATTRSSGGSGGRTKGRPSGNAAGPPRIAGDVAHGAAPVAGRVTTAPTATIPSTSTTIARRRRRARRRARRARRARPAPPHTARWRSPAPAAVHELIVDVAPVAREQREAGRGSGAGPRSRCRRAGGRRSAGPRSTPPVASCRPAVSAGSVASTVPSRYAPPSPRYIRAGGALNTRNAASAPASARPTDSASPPRIANAGRAHEHGAGGEAVLAVEQVDRVQEHDDEHAGPERRRAPGPGTTSAASDADHDLGAEPGPRGEAAASSATPSASASAVREQQREPVGLDRARRAGRGTPRRPPR